MPKMHFEQITKDIKLIHITASSKEMAEYSLDSPLAIALFSDQTGHSIVLYEDELEQLVPILTSCLEQMKQKGN